MKKAIVNAKIINNGEIFENKVLVFDEKIIGIFDSIPYECKVIDAHGNYACSGFIDIHTHGAGGYDFNDCEEENIDNAIKCYIDNGVTSIYPTIVATSTEKTSKILDSIDSYIKKCKRNNIIRGVHLEGPYLSKEMKGAIDEKYITKPIKEDYNSLLLKYNGLIKRWTYAPELDLNFEFLNCLKEYNVVASAGHTMAKFDIMNNAEKNGCKLITHLYSCTSTITREHGFRKLGVIEAMYCNENLCAELIADGKHIPKELMKMTLKIINENRLCFCTDSMRAAGQVCKKSILGSKGDGIPCIIEDGVAKLLDKSAFAGSVAVPSMMIRFAVNEVEMSLPSAIKMLTRNPAKFMGLDNKGSLIKDYDADIVLLNNKFEVVKTFVNGKENNYA